MRLRRGGNPRLAVVDVETTGLFRYDRIVEFACVTVVDGAVVDEYDTLIQPDRDLGPVHVHGITPEMVQSAPKFEAVAADIAERINGAVLVAHNISFDIRMLSQEVDRLGGGFDPGEGLCTYRLTGQKLSLAAVDAGLPAPNHTALADARTSAALVALHAPQGGVLSRRPGHRRWQAAQRLPYGGLGRHPAVGRCMRLLPAPVGLVPRERRQRSTSTLSTAA